MILDKLLEMSNGQSITVDAISDKSIDLSALLRDVGKGKQLYAVIAIDTAVDSADAAKTVTFSIIADSTADLATSATTVSATQAYLGSVLTAGRELIVIPLPPNTPPGATDQYIGMYYDVSATFTAFTLSAYIAVDVQTNV